MYQHCLYFQLDQLALLGNPMKIQTKIQKWGNGLALRLAGVMRDIPRFKEGTPVEVEIFEDKLEIRKLVNTPSSRLPFSEAALLEGMTPETAHADIIASPVKGEY